MDIISYLQWDYMVIVTMLTSFLNHALVKFLKRKRQILHPYLRLFNTVFVAVVVGGLIFFLKRSELTEPNQTHNYILQLAISFCVVTSFYDLILKSIYSLVRKILSGNENN